MLERVIYFGGDNLQVIGYREDSRDAIGAKVHQVLIGFVVHHPLEGNVAILDDDANGLLYPKRVFL